MALTRRLVWLLAAAAAFAASAQEIYRWVDKDGIVHYSDQPGSDKAELVSVIEPNAYESADAAPPPSASSREPDEPADRSESYGTLSIVSPEQDQVFFGADAVVNAQVDMRGTLESGDQLVFFLAAGAVVRLIAPHLGDKTHDPGVLAIDEAGSFVIPLLSGHEGGANAFARRVAGYLGAVPVITTASDTCGGLTLDLVEEQFGWIAEPREPPVHHRARRRRPRRPLRRNAGIGKRLPGELRLSRRVGHRAGRGERRNRAGERQTERAGDGHQCSFGIR